MRRLRRWFYLKIFEVAFNHFRKSDKSISDSEFKELCDEARIDFIKEFNL